MALEPTCPNPQSSSGHEFSWFDLSVYGQDLFISLPFLLTPDSLPSALTISPGISMGT